MYTATGLQIRATGGLQSCCSQPILDNGGRVHGTFTLYHANSVLPSPTEILSLEHYANLTMLAIEREQARLVQLSEHELKAYQSAARRYAAHLETMREEEKNNFAREMHDDIGGTLTALRMEAYLLTKKISTIQEARPLIEHTEVIMKLIEDSKVAMRRIIIGLRPSILDDFGLQEALEWHAAQFHKSSGIECRVSCVINESEGIELGKAYPINLFRIFQEALTNVARHSGATLVEVNLSCNVSEIILSISDNGCGTPENHTINPGSFGMIGMRERAAQLHGKISFGRPPGGGFSVTVRLPRT